MSFRLEGAGLQSRRRCSDSTAALAAEGMLAPSQTILREEAK